MIRRTLRGKVVENTPKRLVVDDGNMNRAYRVVEFYMWVNPTSALNDCFGTLAKEASFEIIQDASNNAQIAWSSSVVDGTGGLQTPFTIVDPNHLVIRDLYVLGQVSGSGGSQEINYMVVIEPVTVSDDEAVLTLIKERSQSELR